MVAAAFALVLTSSAFGEGQPIPPLYTCEGKDISPPLAWTAPPPGTQSLALIADDPDAPAKVWTHWVIYNLPASNRQLKEGFPPGAEAEGEIRQGINDSGDTGYGGPCPPSGVHRYFFKLYALDAVLSLKPGATKKQLESAMEGHILGQGQLMGTYRRKGR